MDHSNLPAAARDVVASYDASSGYYRSVDGTLDGCTTEIPVLEMWSGLITSTRAKTIVETGVYRGLSTCFLASAVKANGGGMVHAVDPWVLPHLWEESDIARFITWHPETSQDAYRRLLSIEIDMLFIDSMHTYAQSAWEVAHFEPLVRPGGYVVFHDSLLHDGVGRTVEQLEDTGRFEIVTTDTPRTMSAPNLAHPVSMGCSIARKKQTGQPIILDPKWLDVPEGLPTGPTEFLRRPRPRSNWWRRR